MMGARNKELKKSLSFQQSALGYLYAAIANLENLIPKEEKIVKALTCRSNDRGNPALNSLFERLSSSWARHIEELRTSLTKLRQIATEEEKTVSALLMDEEKAVGNSQF